MIGLKAGNKLFFVSGVAETGMEMGRQLPAMEVFFNLLINPHNFYGWKYDLRVTAGFQCKIKGPFFLLFSEVVSLDKLGLFIKLKALPLWGI